VSQTQERQDSGIDFFTVTMVVLLSAFLPSVFIVVILFALTYFSSYNRKWWVGLALWGAGMAYYHFWGPGVWNTYTEYFVGLGRVLLQGIGEGELATVIGYWSNNFAFVALNGCLIGGLASLKYYAVGFDIRDLRQQKKRAWKKSLGWWGPSWKQVKSEKSRPALRLTFLSHPPDGTLRETRA